MWEKLHPLLDGEACCDVGNYTLISDNEDVVTALKEGQRRHHQCLEYGPLFTAGMVQCSGRFLGITG